TKLEEYMNLLNALAVSFASVETSASLSASSKLKTDLSKMKADAELTDAIVQLVSIEKNATVAANMPNTRDAESLYSTLDNAGWYTEPALEYGDIAADAEAYANDNDGASDIIKDIAGATITLLAYFDDMLNAAFFYEEQAETALWSGHAFYKGV